MGSGTPEGTDLPEVRPEVALAQMKGMGRTAFGGDAGANWDESISGYVLLLGSWVFLWGEV